jgi:hypothetical protein
MIASFLQLRDTSICRFLQIAKRLSFVFNIRESSAYSISELSESLLLSSVALRFRLFTGEFAAGGTTYALLLFDIDSDNFEVPDNIEVGGLFPFCRMLKGLDGSIELVFFTGCFDKSTTGGFS